MLWFVLLPLLSIATSIYAINRPVYKIVLTQKGYAQFLQYDVETPPLKEFTFCTWIRVYDFTNDQSIFTYVANRNNRIMRLWLDTGGQYLKLSIKNKVTTSFPIEIVKDVWRHVCLSYQSDFGAWALYIDSRLAACNSAQSLYGYMLPAGGSVIVGYGTANDGKSNGLEGEIFGANMILISTIERNYTSKNNPIYEQKSFRQNKLKNSSKDIRYIILENLQTEHIHNNFDYTHNTTTPPQDKKTIADDSNERENIESTTISNNIESTNFDFWKVLNETDSTKPLFPINEFASSTHDLPMISEYETPPPPVPRSRYFDSNFDTQEMKTTSIHKLSDEASVTGKVMFFKKKTTVPSEFETPPPVEKSTDKAKVYGQWTSSKFAGSVLNYLKSINFQGNKDKNFIKTPPTLSLNKLSDAFPYASDIITSRLRPPSQFSRRNLIEKRYDVVKRDPQINVQILENDIRSNILKMHSQTQPKLVDITNRGESKARKEHRFYRNVNYDVSDDSESLEEMYRPKATVSNNNSENSFKKHKSVLPFLKSLEYTVDQAHKVDNTTNDDMYSKSLSRGNKWHNVKSYNNDYTPRKLNIDSENNMPYPSIRLNYKYDNHKGTEDKDDPTILKGRKLAMEVSNHSVSNKDSVSIFKYNHGYLPHHESKKVKEQRTNPKRNLSHNSFDKQVKLGNVLNERHLLGDNESQRKQSFVGGHKHIPDINVYRSDIDKQQSDKVPPSLVPRVCKDVELYDRVLYVQTDESIDLSHILSPLRTRNLAIDFIIQNYKKCSLKDSSLETNSKLFIDWIKTPVRLFGGAFPRRTTDLCGFFK